MVTFSRRSFHLVCKPSKVQSSWALVRRVREDMEVSSLTIVFDSSIILAQSRVVPTKKMADYQDHPPPAPKYGKLYAKMRLSTSCGRRYWLLAWPKTFFCVRFFLPSTFAKIATKAPVEPIPAALHARGAVRFRRLRGLGERKKRKEALAFRGDQERRYATATKVQDALLAT